MVGVAHGGFAVISRFQLALAVNAETSRRLLAQQPVGHGADRAQRGLQQHRTQAVHGLGQAGQHFVGAARAGRVNHQQAGARVDPHQHGRLFGEGHRQQRQSGFFLQVPDLFFAGFAAGGGFDLCAALVHFAGHHRAGHGLGLQHQLHDPLAADGLDHRAVRLAAWRHPADGLFLRHAAFHKPGFLQRAFERLQRARPAGADPVSHQIFEHGGPFLKCYLLRSWWCNKCLG